ncbi:MAG: patatin-like phospholipase family protein [Erythrobacter sp.]
MTSPARSLVLAFAALLSLAACSHTAEFTPPDERCKFERYSLETPLPDEKPLRSIIKDNPGDILLLSGGSQDGAFGAGFLDGWKRSGTMPEFKLVTGISTGALQATGAFIGQPEIGIKGYTIDDEEQLLETYVDGSALENDEFSTGAIITLLRRGAISDLIPLRTRLDALLKPEVLGAVAARYDPNGKGAHLLVGATDVDLGRAVAFDMTEMAHRYATATDSVKKARYKDCYIRALVASSIVPPGARPVFIDNRMYIDGGVRYALFDDRIGEMIDDFAIARTFDPQMQVPRLFAILNATGKSRAVCNKEENRFCEPANNTLGKREDWEVLDLAVRTLELLETQVRRLSVARAEERARDRSKPFFFARIRAEHLADEQRRYAIPDFEGKKTCEEWRADDDADENPIEFHKRYMRCLIEYGRARGKAMEWDVQPRR